MDRVHISWSSTENFMKKTKFHPFPEKRDFSDIINVFVFKIVHKYIGYKFMPSLSYFKETFECYILNYVKKS